MKKDLICILCPRGCHITVDTDTFEVTGNSCPRGAQFGPQEITVPERMLTSTAPISGALHRRIPVRTTRSIPVAKIPDCLRLIKELRLVAPVSKGQVLIPNVFETGVDIVASRSL
ncbi:MAG: DUF1667 domain-containing protein [Brevinema sp.]